MAINGLRCIYILTEKSVLNLVKLNQIWFVNTLLNYQALELINGNNTIRCRINRESVITIQIWFDFTRYSSVPITPLGPRSRYSYFPCSLQAYCDSFSNNFRDWILEIQLKVSRALSKLARIGVLRTQPENPTTVRRTAIWETCVSRHHVSPTEWPLSNITALQYRCV